MKGDGKLLNQISDDLFQAKEFSEALSYYLTTNKIKIKGINSNLQMGYEDQFINYDDDYICVNLDNCLDV